MSADSVPLDSQDASGAPSAQPRLGNVRPLLALFAIFLAVISEPFKTHVMSGLGEKFIRQRRLTTCGRAVQGLCLVIFYALFCSLSERGLL